MRGTTLAFQADPVVPAPAPTQGAGGGANPLVVSDFQTRRAQSQADASSLGTDPANVPLWLVRGEMANRRTSSTEPALPTDMPTTKTGAEAYWLDMPDVNKQAFAQAAMSADMWKPTDGAYGLAQAWKSAVDLAAQYNSQFSSDKEGRWLSPYEAIQKLAPAVAASKNAKFNGFSQTTHVQQFRESDL